jgi:alpha-1,6-mannosyltransferase
MAAAEARASGVPLIVPDRGAALDQVVLGAGAVYRSGSERSLADAIAAFSANGRELQRARAVQNCSAVTMDEHFEQLFSRYSQLGRTSVQPAGPEQSIGQQSLVLSAMAPDRLPASKGMSL